MHGNLYLLLNILILLSLLVFLFIYYRRVLSHKNNELQHLQRDEESRYKDMANLLPQLVVELDEDGKFDFINHAGLDFLGYSKYEIKNGLSIFDIVHPDDKKKFREEFLYLLEGGLNRGQEFKIQTKDQKTFFVVLFLKAIDTERFVNKGLRGFVIDITDRKKLERKVLSTVIETEDKERRRFSEDLHDSLGPLLSTIKLYINQMKSDKVTKEEENEMFAFANELLDEAIISTKNIANNILPGSIVDNGLIAAIATFCHNLEKAGSLKVNFTYNFQQRVEVNYEINIYRIIIELINNSIKHAFASNLEIKLLLEGDKLRLEYCDDGIGFDSKTVKHGLGLENIRNRAQSLNADFQFLTQDKGVKFILTANVFLKTEQQTNINTNNLDY